MALPEILSEANVKHTKLVHHVRESVRDLNEDQTLRLRTLVSLLSRELDALHPLPEEPAEEHRLDENELAAAEERAIEVATSRAKRGGEEATFSRRMLSHLDETGADARSCVALVAPYGAEACSMEAHVVPQSGFDRRSGRLSTNSGDCYEMSVDGRFLRNTQTQSTIPFSSKPVSLGEKAIGFRVGAVFG